MKKIILYLTLIIILTACQKENQNTIQNTQQTNNDNQEQEIHTYKDDNQVILALYEDKNKITSYTTTLANHKDIAVFNIYYTNIDKVSSSNTKTNYLKYYNEYENIENHKNGLYITFEAENKKIEQLILDPSKQHAMTPYLYVYLYDDINQKPNTYYSHLEPKDVDENTIISSFKLYLAQEGSKISSPITVTVFTYDTKDDFTEKNKYRGNSSYTIEIDF